MRTPSGVAMSAPAPAMIAVPMIAERMPPPAPNAGGSWMRKSRLSALAPSLITSKVTMPSAATATTAAPIAAPRMAWLTIRRRRRLPDGLSGLAGSNRGVSDDCAVDVIATGDQAGPEVGEHAHDEQDEGQVEDRVELELGDVVLNVQRDPGRHRVPGLV